MDGYLPYLSLLVSVLLAVACGWLYVDCRGQRKTRASWEAATVARLVGHDKQFVTVAQALAALAPHDARPTTAHRQRLDVAPASGPTPSPPPAPPGPRMRVEVRPTGFPSERHVTVHTERIQSYIFDARDVNEHDSTLPVHVRDMRADEVLVELPPEIPLRGNQTWVNRRFVLDLGDGGPPPAAPAAPVTSEGDRDANPGPMKVAASPVSGAPEDKVLGLLSLEDAARALSVSDQEVRARFEAEADERDASDAARAGGEDDDDERTHVFSGTVKVRPTLAGVPSPSRTATEYRPRQASSATLVSFGAAPPPSPPAPPASTPRAVSLEIAAQLSEEELAHVDAYAARRGLSREDALVTLAELGLGAEEGRGAALTTPPSAPANDLDVSFDEAVTAESSPPASPRPPAPAHRFDPRVAVRFQQLRDAARAAGLKCAHCYDSVPCTGEIGAPSVACWCACEGCQRYRALHAQAEREVYTPRL